MDFDGMGFDVNMGVAVIRELLEQVAKPDAVRVTELADHVENLFEWLDQGRPLPDCWGE